MNNSSDLSLSSSAAEIIFIDSSVDNYQDLISPDNNAEIIVLDAGRDGVEQITESLQNYDRLESIHLISHGREGAIALGSTELSSTNLKRYRDGLQSWSAALTSDADILIYGCNVAAGATGTAFIDRLSQLTTADVAASKDLTGRSSLGGDWELEIATGQIEAQIAIAPQSQNTYSSVLATYNGSQYQLTSQSLSWSAAQTEATSLGGNLVVVNDAAEQDWLVRTFGSNERLWIGLTDANQEGDFQWVDGSSSDYRHWAAGEPNDYQFGGANPEGEDYVLMNWNSSGQWNDMPDSYVSTFRGIIEIPQTQPQSFTYNNHQYLLTDTNSWSAARAQAESLGGNLVTIDDAAEQNWLVETFGNTQFWIGLTDANQEGDFQWADGSSSDYRNWAAGEPNDYQFGGANPEGEDYVLMNWNSSGQWNDMPDSYVGSFQGIVEIDLYSPGVIALETSSYRVNELDNTVEIAVVRTQGTDGRVSIDYATIEDSATAGVDYQATSGTLVFEPGESQKTVSVAILDDDLVEGNEEFGLAIDNIVGDATLLVPRTALVNIIDNETATKPIVKFDDFSNSSSLTLNGNATQQNNVLRLTSLANKQRGSAFFDRPLAIDADTSFSTQFQFQLSGGMSGADGFTFMVQNDPQGIKALGRAGANLGYGGVTQSLAIEFDTYFNSRFDPSNNHISVLQDGNVINALAMANAPFDLNSGAALNAWVDYDGDRNLLAVYLADSEIKPNDSLISLDVDLNDIVGSQGFIGFSAATGGRVNNHDLLDWQLTTNSELLPPPATAVDLNSEIVVSGFIQPTSIEWIPTPDRDTLLIAEKSGVISVFQDGALLPTPFIDLSSKVNGKRDRGLLDIAVHPDFYNGSPYVYALYTYDPPEVYQNIGAAGPDGKGNRAGRLTRITADASTNYTTALPGSEVVILGKNSIWENFNAFVNSTNNIQEAPGGILPDGTNVRDFLAADSESHTVGSVEFGPDGALYVSNGDGASYNQVDPRAARVQDIDNLSGKVLRIDPITGEGLSDNPFYNGDANANRSKVYHYGLRNPFRIAVDSLDGRVFVGDVGWTTWEEINVSAPGANFGWPYYEGADGFSRRTRLYEDLPEARAFYQSGESVTAPFLGLNHRTFGINAIVVGDVYRGNAFPVEYQGDLFFNDLGGGIVRNVSFDAAGNISSIDTFTTGAEVVVQIAQAPDGSLYYVDLNDGLIGRWFFS